LTKLNLSDNLLKILPLSIRLMTEARPLYQLRFCSVLGFCIVALLTRLFSFSGCWIESGR